MSAARFQIGLADGIIATLTALKAERRMATTRTSGLDLVPAKASVVEDELDKRGIGFTAGTSSRSSLVLEPACRAGAVAGRRFEPHRRIEAGD